VEVQVALDPRPLVVLAPPQQQQHYQLKLRLLLLHPRKPRRDKLRNLGCWPRWLRQQEELPPDR
jgi:hypothetical protein